MNDPLHKNKLRRDAKLEHHAIAHDTYLSGFPVQDEQVLELDVPALNGKALPFRTTSLGTETAPVIFTETSTITTDIQEEHFRKNQEKINKLMLDMLAAGVGEGSRVEGGDVNW
jgi:hypothetical protein